MPNTTAVFEVTFTKFNLPTPQDPIYAFVYNPSILESLGQTPDGTTYRIAVHLQSNIPEATITAVDPVQDEPPDFSVFGTGSRTVIMEFTNTGLTSEFLFNFSITVTAEGQSFTSDDPEIEIPPPS